MYSGQNHEPKAGGTCSYHYALESFQAKVSFRTTAVSNLLGERGGLWYNYVILNSLHPRLTLSRAV
jgi:hypothetical protein